MAGVLSVKLPKHVLSCTEEEKALIAEELVKALGVAPPSSLRATTERSMWSQNDELLLAEAEDDMYKVLAQINLDRMAATIAALGLSYEDVTRSGDPGQMVLEKSDNGQHRISDLIELSKQKRQDIAKFVNRGADWTKKQLQRLDDILKKPIDYAKVAEEYMLRAAFLAKIRDKQVTEALNMAGAYIDRFPSTIEASRHEGIVLTTRDRDKAGNKKVKILPLQPQELRTAENAAMRACEKLTEVSDRHRAGIKQVVINAVNARLSSQQLAQQLYDMYGDQNRDWRRVAITELAMATNDAYLAGCDEGDTVWVPPVEGACKHCKTYLEGKTFKVTHDPSKMGATHSDEMSYVWPGKSNFGRNVSTYIPCIPLHPNCRHRYHKLSRFYKVVNGVPTLKTSGELINEERMARGLPPDPNLK